MPRTSRLLVLAIPAQLLVLAACDSAPPLVQVGGSDDQRTCEFAGVTVAPEDGAGPVHRSTQFEVTWRGNADVTADLRVGGAHVSGEAWIDHGRAVFVPHEALPASARIDWRVTGCDDIIAGAFYTGALLHPFEKVEQRINERYELDLRRATLAEPTTGTELGDLVVRWRVAPSLLLMPFSVDDDRGRMSFFVVPGTTDEDGVVRPDATLPWQLVSGSLAENPYVGLRPRDFAVALGEGNVMLRDVELLLGFDEDGFADGRFAAVVDVRRMPMESDPCAVVEAVTSEVCFACDETDRAGSCFFLEMVDVTGVPTDVELVRDMPNRDVGPDVACTLADCPDGPEGPVPVKPAPIEPRWPCPDGAVCPHR